MSNMIRAKKGSWFLGVCKGLEKSNRGNAYLWRLIFVIASCFTFGVPVLLYFVLAIIFPIEKSKY